MPHDPNQPLPADVESMLLKLRKGAAASLDAKRLTAIVARMDGWSLEKVTLLKPSDGGRLIKEFPGSQYHRDYRRSPDGRVHYEASVLDGPGSECYEKGGRAQDEFTVRHLAETVVPALRALEATAKPNAKAMVRDVRLERRAGEYRQAITDVSFEFLARVNAHRITSPDGQVFEVFGDYKNGAIGAQTFVNFYDWAVENTDFLDQVCALLKMEPPPPKEDPKERYVPPPTASAETVRVWEALEAATDGIRAEQTAAMTARMTRQATDFAAALAAGDKRRAEALSGGYIPLVWGRIYDTQAKALRDGWQETVTEVAAQLVEHMQRAFVRKNTLKLASILSTKAVRSPCVERTVVEMQATGGVLTGRLRFAFEDGSRFLVDNSVVLSYSTLGRPFFRFPTTFHNAWLPGGVKMGLPSEERMNEIFAKADPVAPTETAETTAGAETAGPRPR